MKLEKNKTVAQVSNFVLGFCCSHLPPGLCMSTASAVQSICCNCKSGRVMHYYTVLMIVTDL